MKHYLFFLLWIIYGCGENKSHSNDRSLILANQTVRSEMMFNCEGTPISYKEFYGRLIETCKIGEQGEIVIINEKYPKDKNQVCLGNKKTWIKSGLYVETIVGTCDQGSKNDENKIIHFKLKY